LPGHAIFKTASPVTPVIDALGAQIGIPPAHFDPTRCAQPLVDPQGSGLWHAPGMHPFAAHAVPEVVLPLQEELTPIDGCAVKALYRNAEMPMGVQAPNEPLSLSIAGHLAM
jgi:hypothetical protein